MRKKICVVFSLILFTMIFGSSNVVKASDFNQLGENFNDYENADYDTIIGENKESNEESSGAISDFLKDYNPVKKEHMEKAARDMSWFTEIVGYLTGVCIVFFFVTQGLFTAVDIIYIMIPLIQRFMDGSVVALSGGGVVQQGVGAPGMSAQPDSSSRNGGLQVVTNEAIKALALSGSGTVSNAREMNGGSFSSGFGYGRGNIGGNFSNYPMSQGVNGQDQVKPNRKLAISIYFRMRLKALIIATVALIVLTNSLVLGAGLNIAEFALELAKKFMAN